MKHELSTYEHRNQPPTRPQKQMFKYRTGVDMPTYITTLEGASWAIRALLTTDLKEGLILPPEVTTTRWSSAQNWEGYAVPIEGVAIYPLRVLLPQQHVDYYGQVQECSGRCRKY